MGHYYSTTAALSCLILLLQILDYSLENLEKIKRINFL